MKWECEACGSPTEQRSRGVAFCSLGCLREVRGEPERCSRCLATTTAGLSIGGDPVCESCHGVA